MKFQNKNRLLASALLTLLAIATFSGVFNVQLAHSSTVFASSFESGNFSEWTSTAASGTTFTVVNTAAAVHSGTFGVQVAGLDTGNDYAFATKTLTPTAGPIFMRAYVKFTAQFAVNSRMASLLLFNTADINKIDVKLQRVADGTYIWQINNKGTIYSVGGYTLSLDTWYLLEMKAVISSTV